MLLEKSLDLLVNLFTAFFVFLIPWTWYHMFSKIPLKGYFIKDKISVLGDRNYFKIGFKPNGLDHFKTFESESIVAIGWPEIGDLSDLIKKDENTIRDSVRAKVENKYPDINNNITIGQIAGYFVKFLSIKEGDIIVIPRENNLYIYKVLDGYFYSVDNAKQHTSHRVKIDTKNKVIVPLNASSDISPTFKRAAQNRLTLISLNEYATQIEMLINQ